MNKGKYNKWMQEQFDMSERDGWYDRTTPFSGLYWGYGIAIMRHYVTVYPEMFK